MQLTDRHKEILAQLDTLGGITTAQVAGRINPMEGQDSRAHSGAVRSLLLELKAAGFVSELDRQKPVCWIKAHIKHRKRKS